MRDRTSHITDKRVSVVCVRACHMCVQGVILNNVPDDPSQSWTGFLPVHSLCWWSQTEDCSRRQNVSSYPPYAALLKHAQTGTPQHFSLISWSDFPVHPSVVAPSCALTRFVFHYAGVGLMVAATEKAAAGPVCVWGVRLCKPAPVRCSFLCS